MPAWYLQKRKYGGSVRFVKAISDQVRDQVRGCGLTRYRIAQETGIAESVLSRFLGGAGLSLGNLDRLGLFLRMRVESAGPPRGVLEKYGR